MPNHPVELCDGTRYVTYEDVTEERRVCAVLVGEIARLRKKVDCFPAGSARWKKYCRRLTGPGALYSVSLP
ncbi:MAG: hypothetical protein M0P51_01175 [Methanoculleus sp.]|nr:hypothetical protein [Methanoculleus sp.]